jgi:hypothetical protein
MLGPGGDSVALSNEDVSRWPEDGQKYCTEVSEGGNNLTVKVAMQ